MNINLCRKYLLISEEFSIHAVSYKVERDSVWSGRLNGQGAAPYPSRACGILLPCCSLSIQSLQEHKQEASWDMRVWWSQEETQGTPDKGWAAE